jgi:hypothetical protein
MTTITQGAVLFGIVAGGIPYLARGGNTEAIHELDKRIVRLETVMAIAAQSRARHAWRMGTRGHSCAGVARLLSLVQAHRRADTI